MWVLFFLISLAHADFKALDPELKNYSYPFEVFFHSVTLGEKVHQMAYMDVKPEKPNGEAVLLLHGKNFSGNYWERTAKDLVSLGYRVVIPDQIGFGKSSKPEAFPFSFHYMAELTRIIMNDLNIKKYKVVGHSMGGMVATRMALMYPDEVQKLVLVNPIGLEDWKLQVPYKNVHDLYQIELKNNEEKIRDYQKNVYFDGKWKPEYEKGIEILVGWTKHPDYFKVAWNAALTSDMAMLQPVVYEFKNLKMPTYLLIGTRDRTALGKGWADPKVREQLGRYDLLGKKVVKMIPKGKLVELRGIGHMPQVEDYDAYWKNLKGFLKN